MTTMYMTHKRNFHPSMLGYRHRMAAKRAGLIDRMRSLALEHPAWGYRLIHGWLRQQGETSSLGRIRRLWKHLGLSALWRRKHRKIKRGRRVDPPAVQPNSVWCMDFSEDRLQNGRRFMSLLLIKDEATAYALDVAVAPSFKGRGTYRREVLDAEIFLTLKDAEVLSQRWERMYNEERPHSRHGYKPPASAYPFHKPLTQPIFYTCDWADNLDPFTTLYCLSMSVHLGSYALSHRTFDHIR